MIGALPTPLEPEWSDVLLGVARAHRLMPFDDPRFPPLVADMASVYNDDRLARLRSSPREQLAARLGFWFARDVPKCAGAAREAIALRRFPGAPRVLDVGAGLGATHRGLLRALAEAGVSGRAEVIAVDDDREALNVAAAIARARPRERELELRLDVHEASVAELVQKPPRGRFDAILIGQVLSELDLERTEDERVELHAERIATLARQVLAPHGTVIVVEPALRTRTRHLQRLREPLVARGLSIVAPCLHQARCPLLGREGDWCHEDLAVDVPPFLAPIAKRAGLRWEGLTFSYLVLSARSDTRTLGAALTGERRERAVSGLLVTKGKKEIVLCGDPVRGEVPAEDPLGPHGARVGRLDRARTDTNGALDELGRGDVVTLGPLDEKGRLGPDAPITPVRLAE